MRRLECGCEVSAEGHFLSLCEQHGAHVKQRLEVAKQHPRHQAAAPSPNREFERELVKAIAPVVISKWSTATDANSAAESIFQHVQEIMRRLE